MSGGRRESNRIFSIRHRLRSLELPRLRDQACPRHVSLPSEILCSLFRLSGRWQGTYCTSISGSRNERDARAPFDVDSSD